MRGAPGLLSAVLLLSPATAGGDELDVATVIERYAAARGGAERWRQLESLELSGVYAAFSYHEPFRLIRRRDDRYRLDYVVLGSPAIRARDGEGTWGQDPLLLPEAGRIAEDPYKSQLERESLFGLVLADHESRGIAVELVGAGEVEGRSTVDLELTFPGGARELWHLDAESWLEVAIDAQVFDHTQGTQPFERRTFFDDFREVEGLVLPFQVDHEFGARLEAMTVERVRIDPEVGDEELAAPRLREATPEANEPAAREEAGSGP